MTTTTGFSIAWHIHEQEWARLRAELAEHPPGSSTYAQRGAPEFVPYGTLQMQYAHDMLFPPDRVLEQDREILRKCAESRNTPELIERPPTPEEWFPILDAAMQFDRILRSERFGLPDGSDDSQFDEVDGERIITFARDRDTTTIRSNVFEDVAITVPTSEFRSATHRFITEVVTDIGRNSPAALAWETLAPLRSYIRA